MKKALLAILFFGLLVFAIPAQSATVSWDPPTKNNDGSPLTDLIGYNVFIGTVIRNYDVIVLLGTETEYDITCPDCYMTVTACNEFGDESIFSEEVELHTSSEHIIIRGDTVILEGAIIKGTYEIMGME